MDKDAPEFRPIQDLQAGRIIQIQEVGGLHHRYERRAAWLALRLFQSIADLFHLSWHLLRFALHFSKALEEEVAEMRRQIAELKAEDARADSGTKTRLGRS